MIAKYGRRGWAAISFFFYFMWELLLANLRVAVDVMRKDHVVRPGVVAVPIEAESPIEISLLANLVSLTPGTVVLDISSDHKVFYLHVMYLEEILQFRDFEDRFLRIFR